MREFLACIEPVVTARLGAPWRGTGFTDLGERASHRCGIFRGSPIDVFAKLNTGGETEPELRGLSLLRSHGTPVPTPIGAVDVEGGTLLLLAAIPEVTADFAGVGRVLGTLHQVYGERFGLDFDGFFGPLEQDNRWCADWPSFYASRRLEPLLRMAVDSGHLDPALAAGVSRVIDRLPLLCGPDPRPTLLHGDAQQNNFLTGPDGTYLLDVSPYYGHPEMDLALLDYFAPVPQTVFDAYREVACLDSEFPSRRELWRLHGYLAVLTVDGASDFGRPFLGRVADAIRRYR